jgi:O-antigen/teichoic acid export membrane protein
LADQPVPDAVDSLGAKTVIGTAWLLGWRVITRSLGFISTLVLARVLVPADFGLLAMATTFAAVVDALSQLGLQDALVRRDRHDQGLFDAAFTLQAGRAAATSAIIAGAAPLAQWWFTEPRLGPVLLVLAAANLVAGLENVGISDFRRAMHFNKQFTLQLVPRLLQVSVTIPLAIITQSYWALLAGIFISKAARTVMTYVVHPYRPRLRLTGWRELAGFSFWTWAACAASLVWDRLDPFVLGPIFGSVVLGHYVIALELATLPISEIVVPAADALFAAFAAARRGGTSSAHHAPLVAGILVMCTAPLTITISCASADVVAALLGPKWIAAVSLVAILSWTCLLSPFSHVCSLVLRANGYVRRDFIGNVIASVVRLVVLLTAVNVTHRLDLIAVAVSICVLAESCGYLLLLRGTGRVQFGTLAGPMARMAVAMSTTVLLLYELGLAWQPTTRAAAPAFLHGLLTGMLVALVYGVVLMGQWLAAGRPDGPEARLIEMAERPMRRKQALLF